MTNQSQPPRTATKKHIARLERERRQTRAMIWVAIISIVLAAGLVLYGYLDLNYFQLNEPVIEINGQAVTTREFQQHVQVQRLILLNQYQQLQFQQNFGLDTTQQQQQVVFTLQSPQILGQQTLDALTDEILIRQEAEKRGITVTEAEIDEAIQSAYGFFPDGTQTPTVTPTAISFPTMSSQQLTLYPSTPTPTEVLTSTPAPTGTPDPSVTATATPTQALPTPTFVPQAATATATPYTIQGYSTQYAESVENFKSNNGITEETLRGVYEYNLIRDKLMEAIGAEVPRTEEQVWARHILAPDDTTLGIVRSLLLAGWEFTDVAEKYSSDTGSAVSGGDLGWFGRGQMVPEFENAAFSQEIGVVGEPVQSQFGYHIIQVLGHTEIPLTNSQYRQNQETALIEWLAKAKEESTITTNDVWLERVPDAPPGFGQ